MRRKPSPVPAAKTPIQPVLGSTIPERADAVLTSFAVLGLVASISDGDPDYRETRDFFAEFRRRFALSRSQSLRIVSQALREVCAAQHDRILDNACATLNEHLDEGQKLQLIDSLAEILVADGAVHEGEEFFLDAVAERLQVGGKLKNYYPDLQ